MYSDKPQPKQPETEGVIGTGVTTNKQQYLLE
jgi:hypothetical protein